MRFPRYHSIHNTFSSKVWHAKDGAYDSGRTQLVHKNLFIWYRTEEIRLTLCCNAPWGQLKRLCILYTCLAAFVVPYSTSKPKHQASKFLKKPFQWNTKKMHLIIYNTSFSIRKVYAQESSKQTMKLKMANSHHISIKIARKVEIQMIQYKLKETKIGKSKEQKKWDPYV